MDIPKLITVKEMAKILGMHEKVVYRYCRKGDFDRYLVKIGGTMTLRFNLEKVKEAIEKGKI